MSKYQEWKARKDGFDRHVGFITTDKGKFDGPIEDLIDLTGFLAEFTTLLFDFFLDGFSDFLGERGKPGVKLVPSAEYPPEYVLQRILQQASFDLTVIQRAIEQRKNNQLGPELEKYGELALSALAIAFPKPEDDSTWLIDLVKPFVYFQRDTSVRIIPYANALLIGVPFSALCQPIDLLSIAHEIGHHIYETGRFSKKDPINLYFEKYFSDRPDWIRNWLEEIFADLYGFLVAGPISVFSLQEILLDNLPGSLAEDDGEHPVGISRPLAYTELIESKSAPRAADIAEAIITIWGEKAREIGLPATFMTGTQNEEIKRDDAGDYLSSVMYEMNKEANEKIGGNAFDFPTSPETASNLKPWSYFPIDPNDPFSGFIIDEVLDAQKDQINKMYQLYVKKNFMLSREAQNALLTDQISYWADKAKGKVDRKAETEALPPLSPNIWKLIFTAFNWTDKGPDDSRPV